MPRQTYMVCSLSGAADMFTQSVSCFHIVDTIKVDKLKPEDLKNLKPFTMRVVSGWMRDSEEQPNQIFEAKLILYFQENEPFGIVQFDSFSFGALFHRLLAHEIAFPGFPQLGLMFVECHVRRLGEETWIKGPPYPILIEENQQPQEPTKD